MFTLEERYCGFVYNYYGKLTNPTQYELKRLKKHDNGISLMPNNPSYEPAFFTIEQVKILPIEFIGTVLEQRRKIGSL